MSNRYVLLDARTTNGSGSYVSVPTGGVYIALVEGNLDSGTVTLQVQGPATLTDIDVCDQAGLTITLSATRRMVSLYVANQARVRATIAGAGGSLSATVSITRSLTMQ